MNVLAPWAFGLLALVPLLVLLYFLKLKRPRQTVPSTLLWQKVVEDLRVNAPFQKLRKSLLLLLQLLALLAFIFALLKPVFNNSGSDGIHWIVLVDTSASMQAKDSDGKTRLDAAKKTLNQRIDALERGQQMLVISFNQTARLASGFTDSRTKLRSVVDGLQSTDTATDLTPALSLAASLAGTRSKVEVLVLSDGGFPVPEISELPAPTEWIRIGEQMDNIALNALDIRRDASNPEEIELFVEVRNFGRTDVNTAMEVTLDDKPLDHRVLEVAAGRSVSRVFKAKLDKGGVIRVKLLHEDALASDNEAWRIVPPPQSRQVFVVGTSNFFLERVFKSMPGVAFQTVPSAEFNPEAAARATAVVFHGMDNPPLVDTDAIYLNSVPDIPGLALGTTGTTSRVSDWDAAHPANRFTDYDPVVFAAAYPMVLPDDARILVRGSKNPLIAEIIRDGKTRVICGFDPLQSNWPLEISFPLFFDNLLKHFEQQAQVRRRENLSPGIPLMEPVSEGERPVVTLPNGEKSPMIVREDLATFGNTTTRGIYQIEQADGTPIRKVAVNLFRPSESTLELPLDENAPLNKLGVEARTETQAVRANWWKPAVIAVFVLLLLEWAVYHRRWFV